jgi:hypothetical protein
MPPEIDAENPYEGMLANTTHRLRYLSTRLENFRLSPFSDEQRTDFLHWLLEETHRTTLSAALDNFALLEGLMNTLEELDLGALGTDAPTLITRALNHAERLRHAEDGRH